MKQGRTVVVRGNEGWRFERLWPGFAVVFEVEYPTLGKAKEAARRLFPNGSIETVEPLNQRRKLHTTVVR